jgi:hypothetical protein
MKVSVSRPIDSSRTDPEWPGPDRRRWRQRTIDGRLLPPSPSEATPVPPAPAGKTDAMEGSDDEDANDCAPPSPSISRLESRGNTSRKLSNRAAASGAGDLLREPGAVKLERGQTQLPVLKRPRLCTIGTTPLSRPGQLA